MGTSAPDTSEIRNIDSIEVIPNLNMCPRSSSEKEKEKTVLSIFPKTPTSVRSISLTSARTATSQPPQPISIPIPPPSVPLASTAKSTWQSCLQHKRALFWSSFISLAAILWGYDALLSGAVVSIPSFKKDFGYFYDGEYIVSASWQMAFNTSPSVGGFFGCLTAGWLADKFGRRWTLAGGCFVSIGGVLVQVFSYTKGVLLAGKLINGLTLGLFLTISSSYAAEVCPTPVRGVGTSAVQFYISFGQLFANLMIKAFGYQPSRNAYRIPFAIQLAFPVLILIGLPWCPESPWYLVRKQKHAQALNALERLGNDDPNAFLMEVQEIVQKEEEQKANTTYLDCFRGTDLRRSMIAMGSFSVSQLTGVVFVLGYSSYFFELAGLSSSKSFSLSLGVTLLGIVGVVLSWFLINSAGRRPTLLWGTVFITFVLLLMGIMDVIPTSSLGPLYVQVACIILFSVVYFLSIGPMAWAIFAEISSSRLRSRTVGLGLVVQNLFGVLLNTVVPLMINPDAGNLGGKVGFVFAGTSAIAAVWVWWQVPETRGVSVGKMDGLFERRCGAREFGSFVMEGEPTRDVDMAEV